MQVEATRGTLQMRFGRRFAAAEAERLEETIVALGPVNRLTLDFSDVREFEDAAFVPLARTLRSLDATARVSMRGLTLHQRRMLKYFGVDREAVAEHPAARPSTAAGM